MKRTWISSKSFATITAAAGLAGAALGCLPEDLASLDLEVSINGRSLTGDQARDVDPNSPFGDESDPNGAYWDAFDPNASTPNDRRWDESDWQWDPNAAGDDRAQFDSGNFDNESTGDDNPGADDSAAGVESDSDENSAGASSGDSTDTPRRNRRP